VPNAIDRDGMEPAYPIPGSNGRQFTVARDGQLQRPLTGQDATSEQSYLGSKTEVGAGLKFMNDLSTNLTNTGTLLQVAGYALAAPTEGASLTLVAWGATASTGGSVVSMVNDAGKKDYVGVATTAATMIISGGITKAINGLTKDEITSTGKVILNATNAAFGKAMDVTADKAKENRNVPQPQPVKPMQQDNTSAAKPPIVQPVFK